MKAPERDLHGLGKLMALTADECDVLAFAADKGKTLVVSRTVASIGTSSQCVA